MPTFDELLGEAKQRGDAQRAAALSQASTINPEAYAQQRRQAAALGVPTAAVTAIPDEMGARAKQVELNQITADAPVLRQRYTDEDFARLGQGEPGVLSQIERAVGKTARYVMGADEGGGLPGAVYRQGWLGAKVAGAGLGRVSTEVANWLISPVVGQDNAVGRLAMRFAAEGKAAQAEQERLAPQDPTMLRQMADSGFGSAAQMGKYLPMAALGPAGIAAALVGMSTEAGATSYQSSREKGVAIAPAVVHGLTDAGAEFITEKYIGGAKFLENLVTGQGFKKIAASMGVDAAGEMVAQVWQNFNEWMIANPGKTAEDFVKEQPEQMAIAAGASVIGGGAQAVTYKAAARVVEAATGNARRIAEAQDDAKTLTDLFTAAASSKLLVRAPETLAQFAQQAAEHHDGIKSVYIDAQTLNEVLQQSEMPAEMLLPYGATEFAEALASNGTVELPIGALVAAAAGKPIEAALLPHLRTSPDGLSETEATKAQGEAQKLVEAHAEEVLQAAENEAAARASHEVVRNDILQQLNAAGRFTLEQNTVQANLAAAFFTSMGARLGMTAEEFYAAHPLRIQATGRASDAIDQGGGLTVEGYHYSKEDRAVLTTGQYGTGLRGSGFDEIMAHPDQRLRKRLSFYVDKGTGINPEAGVGGRLHKAQLKNLYDANRDPLRLRKGSQQDFEARVLDAGYSGYVDRLSGTQSGHAILLGDQTITPEVLGDAGKTKGAVVPPAAPKPSLGRDVAADAVRSNKSLPAGELTRERWGTLLKALEPAAYAEMQAAGVFEGEGKFYKDGLVADFEGKTEAPDYKAFAQVTPEQAMATNTPVELPTTPEFREAVDNTPGAEITPDGLKLDLVRFQKPEQEGGQAIRTGVFYLPAGSHNTKHYKTGKTGYGGTEKFEGETLLRRPLFVKGATGGKAPEAAYDAIKGKGASKALDKAVMEVVTSRGFMSRIDAEAFLMNVEQFLGDNGGERGLAREIIENSKQGNTLRYALQEHVIAHAVRKAGYDSVVGYSKGKAGAVISEVFDVREQTFPARGFDSQIHEAFEQRGLAQATLDDFTPSALPDLLSKDGWAVLTAEDPNATKATPEANAAAQAALRADLDALGAKHVDAVGKYGDVQGALIVTGITEEQALALGRKYGQESVLTRSGLVYSADGHIVPALGMDVFDEAPDDFYTEIPSTGGYFSVQLDFDNPIPGDSGVFNQTDSAAFKEWFGDSKVVDADGEPLVVYHGTEKAGFDRFDLSKAGENTGREFSGAYFTNHKAGAATYSGTRREAEVSRDPDFDTKYDGGAGNYSVFLSIKDPLVVDFRGANFDANIVDDGNEYFGMDDVVEMALAAGADGVIAKNLNDEGRHGQGYGRGDTTYVVFSPEQIKSAIGNDGTFDANDPSILSQQTRGTFSPSTKTITLLATANLSTFTHELGHYYLDTMAGVASQPDAPAQVVEDMSKLLKWMGVESLEAWQAMSLEEQRPHHEQLAEGFENYIFEGKAPSAALQPTFQRLREFMISAYKSLAAFLRGHSVKLNAEVRQVFDRMIASDEEIAAAERAAQYQPLFKSAAEADMSEEEYQAYVKIGDSGTRAAVDDMTARSMRDLARTRSQHAKAAKALQAEINAQRKVIEAEVTEEVNAMPVYQAERWLVRGELVDADGAEVKATKGHKLNTDGVIELFPETMLGRPDLARIRSLTASTGLPPDLVATMFGFADGRALVQALIDRTPKAEMIAAMTDERMLLEHGELTTPEGIARAADESVHNDARARALATELKMLRDANTPTAKSPGGASVNVLLKAAKDFATTIANRTKIGKLNPKLHVAAEQRAAKKAAELGVAKKPQEAIAAKRDQLLNFHAAQAVRDGVDEVRKMRAFFDRVLRGNDEKVVKGGRDADVVNAARAVLSLYGLGGKPALTASEYVDLVKRYDPDMGNVLADAVTAAEANAKPFGQLTLEEARALADEVQVLWVLAKRSRQMEVAGDLIDREQVQQELKDRLVEIGIPDTIPGEGKAVTARERALRHLKDFAAAARRVESWVGAKDGAAVFGPFRRYVWQPIKDAATRYHAERAVYRKALIDLVKPIAPTLGRRIIQADELGYTFGHSSSGSAVQEIVHAILHTGNDSNKRKLLLGRGWATENADGTLNTTAWDTFIQRMIDEGHITKAHYDFAQGVWDLLERTKPAAQATHRAVFGRYFKEVTADAFVTPFGTYSGGYVPAITDAAAAADAATRKLMEDENASMQFAFPSTNKGFTKSRVEYNSKLLLDLNALTQHIDKVLLFTHMEQPVRDARRVLTAKEVAGPLNRIDPSAMTDLLTPWLNRAARQQVETPATTARGAMRLLSSLRRNVGASAMFLNLANAAQQITGLATAAAVVKPKYLRSAAASMIAHPVQTTGEVIDASDYMRQRLKDEMQHLSGEIQDILVNPSLLRKSHDWTLRNAYFLQRAVDYATSPIVWKAAYNEAVTAGLTEEDAIARADGVVRETQGAQAPEDVANIETGNAFVRMFTQFTGFFNMNANLMASAFAKGQEQGGLRKGLGRAVFIFPAVVLVPAILGELISQLFKGGPPDEDDDGGEYLDDWFKAALLGTAKYMAAMVPGVGGVLAAGIGQFTDAPFDDRMAVPPAVAAVERAVQLPEKLANAVAEGGHKAAIATRELGALLGAMGIIAAPAVAKRIAYGIDVAADEVNPTGPIDATRGALTGTASPASKGK